MLGDRVIDHPGAALVTESRPDIYMATAGYRARLGPIEVFNPENVSGIPSTFTWGMTIGCEDPAEAIRRAANLVGAVANTGEMAWWVEKSAAALAAGMHAAALLGGDMGDVWAWSNGYGTGTVEDARAHPAASPELFGALAELDRPGKTADSIRLTMSKALTWLAIPDIRAMVTGPRRRGRSTSGAFTDARGTIYMLAPGGDGAPCAPLFRCFASYIHRAARHHGLAQPHRKLDPGLLFALDELHLCPVDLPAWLADSAGKGIQVAAVVHSTGQLRDKYGEHGAATVWSTAGTKIFLPGIHDTATLEDVSKLCGTLGDGDHARRVMPPELLARLPDWHALVVAGSRSPVVIKFRPSWRRIEARLGRAPQAAAELRLPHRRTAGTAAGHHRPRRLPPGRRAPRTARRTMTSPPEPSPAADTAALAAQVAALRGQVAALKTRLDNDVIGKQLVALAEIKRLRSQVTELAHAVTENPRRRPPARPRRPLLDRPQPRRTTPHSSPSSGSGPTPSCAANTAATSSPTAGPTTRTPSGNCPPWPPNGTAPTAATGPAWTGRWNSTTGGCPAPCAASPTSPAGATPNAPPGHEP